MSPDEKEKMDGALGTVKEALRGTDINAIRTAHEQLMYATQGFASRLYEQSGSQPDGNGAGGPGGPGAGDDDVVDAEIVDG